MYEARLTPSRIAIFRPDGSPLTIEELFPYFTKGYRIIEVLPGERIAVLTEPPAHQLLKADTLAELREVDGYKGIKGSFQLGGYWYQHGN